MSENTRTLNAPSGSRPVTYKTCPMSDFHQDFQHSQFTWIWAGADPSGGPGSQARTHQPGRHNLLLLPEAVSEGLSWAPCSGKGLKERQFCDSSERGHLTWEVRDGLVPLPGQGSAPSLEQARL